MFTSILIIVLIVTLAKDSVDQTIDDALVEKHHLMTWVMLQRFSWRGYLLLQ